VAEHAAEARIDIDEDAVEVGPAHADGRLVENASEAGLAFLERQLKLFAGGDVLNDGGGSHGLAGSARNERDVDLDPNGAAILANVALLRCELRDLTPH